MKNNLLENEKLIVILRNIPQERFRDTVNAMVDGGVRFMEITFDHSSSGGHLATANAISLLNEYSQGIVQVGAGTVLTPEQAELAAMAGAQYIISPNSDRMVIEKTKELGLISIPGALTPSEIVQAYHWGADYVKIFPMADLGVSYLKSLKTPLSHIPMLAVGGINVKNFMDYIHAGAAGIGVGSGIADMTLIMQGKYREITCLAQKYTSTLSANAQR
jgi:2-dehydro-3-deoxyphosphogluconate aldolase/(4S)-4-hydroxy-2-oxoglutarate aldolase